MLNSETISVNEAPEAQLLNQEQQKTIDDINALLANNNKEISTINDLLNKDFLKGISAELAGQILTSIPDQLQNDPNIKKVIIVLSAKTSVSDISGNNSNLQNYSNNIGRNLNNIGNIDIGSFTIDLSNYKKDISGNSESYGLTGLTGELQQCLNLIGSSENLQNLKNNLEGIKKIIEGKSTNLNDLNKIEQFLNDNQINLEPWNENDISPLLQGVHKFILNIAPTLSHNKSNQEQANRILEEEEQKIIERNTKLTEMSTAFSNIEKNIPDNLADLSKLSKKNIQNIKDFITESKSNNTISTHTNAKESVFLLYLKMYRCQQALNGSGITHRDRNNFDEVFNHIRETFNNNEIQNYELGLQFKGINETNLKSAAPQNWDGKFLTDGNNDSFLQTVCRGHLFQPKDYMDKFNSINRNRIENIIPQLQNYNISNFLQYFELNASKDGLIPKNDKEQFNSLPENERTATLQGILIKQVANTVTNLINGENEIKRIIGEYNGGENANILTDWTNKIIEELKKQSDAPEGGNGNQETEMTFENLPDLDTNSIKKVFSNLDKQDIVKFFKEQKTKTDLTEPQKKQLILLYEGLTKRFPDSSNNNINLGKQKIEELQQELKQNDANLVIDGKFGINTFNALRNSFDVPQLTSRPQTIKVEKRSENIPEGWEYQETFNNGTKLYRITDLKYLIDPNSFPENSCVEYNGIRFTNTLSFYDKNEPNGQGNGTRNKFQGDNGVLLQYTDSDHEHIQYLPIEKFSQYTDEYEKIEKNDKLFLQILKELHSDTNNCYGLDSNNNISNDKKTNPKYYEKNGKLIQKWCDRTLSIPINKYKIWENGKRIEMGGLKANGYGSLAKYTIYPEYKDYV